MNPQKRKALLQNQTKPNLHGFPVTIRKRQPVPQRLYVALSPRGIKPASAELGCSHSFAIIYL